MKGDTETIGFVSAIILGLFLFLCACVVVHAWDYHEARHNRITCAEFNADTQNMNYPDRPAVTIRTSACHPSVP